MQPILSFFLAHWPSAMDDDEALSFRCSPTVTAKLISLLPAAVVKRLDDAGLRQMREFKLDGIGSRVILSQLLKRTVVDEENNRIQIIIKEGQSLWIDTNIVQFILDMPTGSDKALPVAESELVEAEYMKLYEALLYVKKKTADTAGTAGTVVTEEQPGTAGIAGTVVTEEQPNRDTEDQPSSETEEQTRNETREHASNETADQHTGGQPSQQIAVACRYAKEARQVFTKKNIEALFQKCEEDDVKRLTTTDMLTRLYMAVLLDELLLASSSSYITSALLKNVYQLEKLKDVDWPYIVYDCLKKSCSGEKTKNRGGCVIVHMVSTRSLNSLISS
jgi:RNase P/RNase MRP subunit p29